MGAPPVWGIAKDVALRLGSVLPRAVTRISDRMELHLVFLKRHATVTSDAVETNVGCRHRLVAILAKRVGVNLGGSATKSHLLPLVLVAPGILVVDRSACRVCYRLAGAFVFLKQKTAYEMRT